MARTRDLLIRFGICILAAIASVGVIRLAEVPQRSTVTVEQAMRSDRSNQPVEGVGPAAPNDAAEADWEEVLRAWREGSPMETPTVLPEAWNEVDAWIDRAFDRLSDREVIELLVEHTTYDRDALESVRDLRAFVKRNAQVWIGGATAGAGESATPAFSEALEFSRRVTRENEAREPTHAFGPDARKIYATFPAEGLGGNEVTVVWRDLDRSKVLLYQRQPIDVGDDHHFIWLKSKDAWPPGEYAVEIYTGDESLSPVAVGIYSVTRN